MLKKGGLEGRIRLQQTRRFQVTNYQLHIQALLQGIFRARVQPLTTTQLYNSEILAYALVINSSKVRLSAAGVS